MEKDMNHEGLNQFKTPEKGKYTIIISLVWHSESALYNSFQYSTTEGSS